MDSMILIQYGTYGWPNWYVGQRFPDFAVCFFHRLTILTPQTVKGVPGKWIKTYTQNCLEFIPDELTDTDPFVCPDFLNQSDAVQRVSDEIEHWLTVLEMFDEPRRLGHGVGLVGLWGVEMYGELENI